MGNASKNKTNDLLDKERSASNNEYNPLKDESSRRSSENYNLNQGNTRGLTDRYTDLADSGGYDPDTISRIRAAGSGGGGHVDDLDESRWGTAIKGYEDFATGGGGIDKAGIRARSNSVIPSFYKNLQNEQSRRRLVNPYAPSFDAESAAMARQSGQQTQENVRNTELDIEDQVSKNKQWGISGLGGLQTNIAGLKQQGQIANAGFADSAASRKSSSEMAIAQMVADGKMRGLGGLQGIADTQNNNALAYSNQRYSGTGDNRGQNLDTITNRQNTTSPWGTVLGAVGQGAGAYFSGGSSIAAPGGMKKPKSFGMSA